MPSSDCEERGRGEKATTRRLILEMLRRGQKLRRRLDGVWSSVCLTCCLVTPHAIMWRITCSPVCWSCFESAKVSLKRERKKAGTSADGLVNIECWFSVGRRPNRRRKKPQRLYFKACVFIISWLLSMHCWVFAFCSEKKKNYSIHLCVLHFFFQFHSTNDFCTILCW